MGDENAKLGGECLWYGNFRCVSSIFDGEVVKGAWGLELGGDCDLCKETRADGSRYDDSSSYIAVESEVGLEIGGEGSDDKGATARDFSADHNQCAKLMFYQHTSV